MFNINIFYKSSSCNQESYNNIIILVNLKHMNFLWENKEGYNLLCPFLLSISPLWEMVQEGIDIKSIKWTQH